MCAGGGKGCEWRLPLGDEPRSYLLVLQVEGSSSIRRAGAMISLACGDMGLVAQGSIALCKAFDRSRQVYLHVPIYVPQPFAPQSGLAGVRLPPLGLIDGNAGIGYALRALVLEVRAIAHPLSEVDENALRGAVLGLAAVALGSGGTRDLSPDKVAAEPRQALLPLRESIEDWLSDPALCPKRVADAHGISIRQLHRIFNRAGTSFSAFVRRRRLERCRDDLADPRLRALPMTEIAFRWGFSDSSHFSRSFRAAFGCTARDFRASHTSRS
ncbi:MAG: helix-turn-helix domain-containing protein [Rhodospirillales bacterium]|nr:helix-turn-helix domain-containing protein [Rhodospirillales bacterium]